MKILFVSLGCDKNLVDSEKMLGMLQEKGYTFTDDEAEADVVVVNTCCFIGDAKEESINTLLQMGELKDSGQVKALIAAGCLAQRYREEIQKEIPQVDAIIGTTAIDEIVAALEEILAGQKQNHYEDINAAPVTETNRVVTTGGHFAYLKIAEGCDKHCTYCIIPKVRGNYRSVPKESLLKEARELADKGVRELILVAQETTLYGVDLYGKKELPGLLHELAQIPGIYWIRILYCYPEEITDELIDAIAAEPKVCNYLDIPIQHASDNVLKRMGRHTDQAELRAIIGKLREKIPDICLRTTLISGFPGETQEDFEELYRFVNEMEFDRLGVFPYSHEEDTYCDKHYQDDVPEETKNKRAEKLMALQEGVVAALNESCVGKRFWVLIDRVEGDYFVGRTQYDSPEVDQEVFVTSEKALQIGEFYEVLITEAGQFELYAKCE